MTAKDKQSVDEKTVVGTGNDETIIGTSDVEDSAKTHIGDADATFIGDGAASELVSGQSTTDSSPKSATTVDESAQTQTNAGRDATVITPIEEYSEKTFIDPLTSGVDSERPADQTAVEGTDAGGDFSVDQATFVSKTGHSDVDVNRSAAEPSAVGKRIGDYEVVGELGRGGMGVVYKARHVTLNRTAALKMILNGEYTTRLQLDRFLQEARAVAALQHTNIVQIFDIGEHESLPWFTLEFVDGQDLAQVLKGEPQTPENCAKTVETLARAMHYAHGQNIIHRDLKPANVLVSSDGVAKITDFGLAKQIEGIDSGKTRTGTIMGSPSYMSPEQAEGKTDEVGPASDQYSLGAVLYQMITARAPFAAAKPLDTITQVVKNDPIPPRKFQPEVPIDLETICLKTLQKDPKHRYANCLELADDLRRYINDEPILARPISKLETAWKWCKRNPLVAIPSAASIGMLALTAIISLWSYLTVSAQNTVISEQKEQVEQEKKKVEEQKKQVELKNLQILEEKTKVEEQKEVAVAMKVLAEENETLARKHMDLTLKNLQTFINKIDGRLSKRSELRDLRLEVLNDVSEAWNSIDEAVRDDKKGQAIPTRMGARFKLAQIYQQAGDLQKAYDEATKLYETGNERQLIQQWTDATRINQARIILMLMGPLRKQIDRDSEAVLKHYQEAVRLCRDILDSPKAGSDGIKSDVDVVRAVLSESLQRLGAEYLTKGDVPAAYEQFSEARLIREVDLRKLTDSEEFKKADAAAQAKAAGEPRKVLDLSNLALGYVLLRMEEPERAIEFYQQAVKGRRAAHEADPANQDTHRVFAGTLSNLGMAWHWMNQFKEGKKQLKEAVQSYKSLYEQDTGNANVKRQYATAMYRYGALLFDNGEPDAAEEQFKQCRSLRAELAATGGTEYRKHYMQVLARVGELDESAKMADELGQTDKPDPDVHFERCQALSQIARQKPDDAAAMDAAFAALDRCVKDGYSDPYKLRVEPDFKPLRSDARFEAVLKRVEERNKK